MQQVTVNVPSSHGGPHLLRVALMANALASSEGVDPELAFFTGLFHDLRFWDEAERKTRKLNIPSSQTGSKDIGQVLEEFAAQHGWPAEQQKSEMLHAVLNHSKVPVKGEEAPPLLRVLRDADRCSRLGRDGLLSIFQANQNYEVPFYNEGEPMRWNFSDPLMENSKIKCAVGDVQACLSWWQIMETDAGRALFKKICGVNVAFLNTFSVYYRDVRDYDTWIRWISQLPPS